MLYEDFPALISIIRSEAEYDARVYIHRPLCEVKHTDGSGCICRPWCISVEELYRGTARQATQRLSALLRQATQ